TQVVPCASRQRGVVHENRETHLYCCVNGAGLRAGARRPTIRPTTCRGAFIGRDQPKRASTRKPVFSRRSTARIFAPDAASAFPWCGGCRTKHRIAKCNLPG